MNPIDHANTETKGKEDTFGLFKHIAKERVETEMTKPVATDSTLKTTSVRLQEKQLKAFDAVIRSFDLTRNEVFSYALNQFMADAIAGYAVGRADAYDGIGALGDKTFEQVACDESSRFVNALELDEETHAYLSGFVSNELFKRLGVE